MNTSRTLKKCAASLAIASLASALSHPAKAQWVLSSPTTESGTASYVDVFSGPMSEDIVDASNQSPWVGNRGYNCSIIDTVNPVFVWQGPGTPPATVYALITAAVYVQNQDPLDYPVTLYANDGFNDPQVNGYNDAESIGKHLIQLINPSHSSSITLPFFTLVGNGGLGDGDGGGAASDRWFIVPDTRGATITSNIEPTYHKGANDPITGLPTLVEDLRDNDNDMTATTVGPDADGDPSITYSGHSVGSFAASSSYDMYDVDETSNQSGSFTGAGLLTSFTDEYTTNAQEHVTLKLIGASDGATAIANYYVNFHNVVEDWTTNTGPVATPASSPTPTSSTYATLGWSLYNSYHNSSGTTEIIPITEDESENVTVTGTIGKTGLPVLSSAVVDQSFLTNMSVTIGQTITASDTETTSITVPAGKTVYVFWAPTVDDYAGTCDVYGSSGYSGQENWTLENPTGGISWAVSAPE